MNIKLLGIVAACSGLLAVACGDDTGTGGAGGGTGGSSAGGAPVGGAADGGGGMAEALTCQTGCEALYACGLEGEPQYCAGFTPEDEQTFLNGSDNNGCVATCMGMMALLGIVNPDDCEATINNVSGVSADFANVCENGVSQGGAGQGGAGGAP